MKRKEGPGRKQRRPQRRQNRQTLKRIREADEKPVWVGLCSGCGKRCFRSAKAARKWIRRQPKLRGTSPYLCGRFYHLGNLPVQVKDGRMARSDLGPPALRGEPLAKVRKAAQPNPLFADLERRRSGAAGVHADQDTRRTGVPVTHRVGSRSSVRRAALADQEAG